MKDLGQTFYHARCDQHLLKLCNFGCHQQVLQKNQEYKVSVQVQDAVINYALRMQKALTALSEQDFVAILQEQTMYQPTALPFDQAIVEQYQQIVATIVAKLENAIEQGSKKIEGLTILHTAPHHDDIILGYHAYAVRNLQGNKNYIAYITNGSNGVSDRYLLDLLQQIAEQKNNDLLEKVFENFYQQLLEQFAQAFFAQDHGAMQQVRYLIFLKLVAEVFGSVSVDQLQQQLIWLQEKLQDAEQLIDEGKDVEQCKKIIMVKERLRQSESDAKWMIAQGHHDNVTHFGAQFYQDQSDKAFQDDVERFALYLQKIKPDILTVACDPQGIGPSTHFSSLSMIAKAVALYEKKLSETCPQKPLRRKKILGYRNVWGACTLAQTSMIVPVTTQEIDAMETTFTYCFATQQNPVFPVPLHEGNFAHVARQFLEQQGVDVALLLGHGNKFSGAIFLQQLTVDELMKFVA